jgi:hypothetical protein
MVRRRASDQSMNNPPFHIKRDAGHVFGRWAIPNINVDRSPLSNSAVVKGFEITVDARCLSGPDAFPVLHTTLRLLPAPCNGLEQGLGSVGRWPLAITGQGAVDYDAAFDIAHTAFLAGRGTSTLLLLGYPLLVDAHFGGDPVSACSDRQHHVQHG